MKVQFNTIAGKCLFSLIIVGLIFVGGCKKDKKNEVKFNNIAATGAQEAPTPNSSTATATMNATYDKDTKVITFTLTFSGLNPVNGHFHKGATGTAGPVVIDLKPASGTFTSPMSGSTRALTAAEETDLLAGTWYYNLHTSTYPAGEIRGQMVAN